MLPGTYFISSRSRLLVPADDAEGVRFADLADDAADAGFVPRDQIDLRGQRADGRDASDKTAVGNNRHIQLYAVETAAIDDRRIEPNRRVAADDSCRQNFVLALSL